MNKGVLAGAIVLALFAGACSAPLPAPTPFPTLPPIPLTLVAAVPSAPPTSTATVQPTATATPTYTPTATVNSRFSPTPSRAASQPISPTASPSPVPSLLPTATTVASGFPPGVYIIDLRTDPNPPNRTTELKFYATFVNSMGSPQNYRWIVYIYKFDTPTRSTGETTQTQVSLPNGSSEQKSDGSWRLGPGNQCENFFARVARLDQDRRPTMFTQPDGKVFEKSMTLCP